MKIEDAWLEPQCFRKKIYLRDLHVKEKNCYILYCSQRWQYVRIAHNSVL